MAQNVTIAGADFPAVPALSIPLTGGGGNATFVDTSDADAVAGDIASGKTAYVNGTKLTGTGSGGGVDVESLSVTQNGTYTAPTGKAYSPVVVNVSGGGGGLVYETGTYTPTENVARPTISFSNQHTEAPICVILADASQTQETESNSNTYCAIVNFEPVVGYIQYSNTARRYGFAHYGYRASSPNSATLATTGRSSSASSNYDLGYWITNSAFMPYSNSTSRYWIAGRTYKWIAIWAPTT